MIPKIVRTGGLTSGTLVFAALVGCNQAQPEVRYVSAPPPAPVMQVQPTVVVQEDDYVYYPAYEVYYSSSRRDYRYRDGNAWVTRAAPPRVSIQVLFASPSVHMDFRDAPERHHETVIRSYPRNWSPPGRSQVYQNDNRDDRRNEPRPVVQVQAAAVIQVQPAPVIQVQRAPVVVVQQDDYVYYPAYEVYYSSSRRDYHYRDGNAWVTRAAPPRVSAQVLFASPSVRMDFRDAPEHHHETVIRSYPKNWSPPGHSQRDHKDDKDERKDDKDERKDDRKDKH